MELKEPTKLIEPTDLSEPTELKKNKIASEPT